MKKVLFIGAHCDDIELGCGATINKHRDEWDMQAVTMCRRGKEGFPTNGLQNLWETSRKSLASLGIEKVWYHDFPICEQYKQRQEVWLQLRTFNEIHRPDIVFTHTHDEARDHQVVHDESIRTFEQATIYCYSPSITIDPSFIPDVFEPVSEDDLDAKIKALHHYEPYREKIYFQDYVIKAQATMVGVNSRTRYAEGFQLHRKMGFS